MSGMFHLYTGNGKGKTTAAIGLTIRALGAGWQVFFGQFIKGQEYSEIKILNSLKNVTVEQFGLNCFIRNDPTEADIEAACQGLERVGQILKSGEYQLVILDEANIAIYYQLFSSDQLLEVIENRAKEVEVVVTGRKAHSKLIAKADLVTNMEEIKHYYQQGIMARVGVEK